MSERLVQVDDLVVPLDATVTGRRQALDQRLGPWLARHLGISEGDLHGYELERRSVDARDHRRLALRYRLRARVRDGAAVHEGPGVAVLETEPETADPLAGRDLDPQRPADAIVVGTGPAGIMAAYLLARHGTRVLVLDRGRDVARRQADIERFHDDRQLDPDSNYLFGEGGAGTYSDGKLYTRAKDRRLRFLLEALVAARAPRHILWRHHPHIGSDILPHVARRLRARIEAWGGCFRWHSEVVDVIEHEGRCRGVVLADGERIEASCTLIAPGHSARGLVRTLARRGLAHRAKGWQLGCRIEHPQGLVDRARYGRTLPSWLVSAAEYNLVSRPQRDPSTTTFCMCPGGEIICATSDPGQLSTNGMSRHARASGRANAGLIVNQPVDREHPLAALDHVDALERAAFDAGGGDYACPAQTASAFLRGQAGPPAAGSSYRLGIVPGRIDRLLPAATVAGLRAALRHFDRQVPGFIAEGLLVGIETRVSLPLRFDRHPDTLASSLPGLWLAGEGAGYAGGIVSAALDGLRLAETLLTGRTARRER